MMNAEFTVKMKTKTRHRNLKMNARKDDFQSLEFVIHAEYARSSATIAGTTVNRLNLLQRFFSGGNETGLISQRNHSDVLSRNKENSDSDVFTTSKTNHGFHIGVVVALGMLSVFVGLIAIVKLWKRYNYKSTNLTRNGSAEADPMNTEVIMENDCSIRTELAFPVQENGSHLTAPDNDVSNEEDTQVKTP